MSELTCESGTARVRIGVSACLLGKKVRFDGGHKRDRFIDDVLRRYFELVPICPEVAIGMGTPREPIRLAGDTHNPRAIGTRNPQLDVTRPLREYGKSLAGKHDELCGFVFKKGSPSCGMERVKVYTAKGMPHAGGTGLFAREIMAANPLLPVEEEGRLNDTVLRENFILRVYVYARWRALQGQGLSRAGLVAFHARHKLLVMAHSQNGYRELGRMVAGLHDLPLDELARRYFRHLMELLGSHATRKRHVNVLQHLLGYLRGHADPVDRADLVDAIDAYRRGEYPLVVPLRLLHHHFRRHPDPYVSQQVYMHPYPDTLSLRNAL